MLKQEEKKNKKFRLKSKKLFLTYPQLNPSEKFIKEEVLKQLEEKLKNIESYLIGEEIHEDGGIHIHCFFELKNVFDTSIVNYLDLNFEGKTYHGNYQAGKNKNTLIEYIIKEDNYITNMKLSVKNGKLLKPEEHLFNVCAEEGIQKTMDTLYEYYPVLAIKRGGTILKNLEKFSDYKTRKESIQTKKENIFKIEDFDQLSESKLKEILNWMDNGSNYGYNITLILHGPGGTGKTMLAKSIFKTLEIEPLTVSQINDFKNYDPSKHKGVLIDDLDAESLSRLETLNLIDSVDGKSIRVLYGVVSPIGLIPKIITTNKLEDFTKNGAKELIRRLKDIYISESISSKFNIKINIQNNIQNINYFFGESLGISKEVFQKRMSQLELFSKTLPKK
jgi:hypothetical protein